MTILCKTLQLSSSFKYYKKQKGEFLLTTEFLWRVAEKVILTVWSNPTRATKGSTLNQHGHWPLISKPRLGDKTDRRTTCLSICFFSTTAPQYFVCVFPVIIFKTGQSIIPIMSDELSSALQMNIARLKKGKSGEAKYPKIFLCF